MFSIANSNFTRLSKLISAELTTLNLNNIKERPWLIQACSAIKGDGLQDGMEWLVKTISNIK